MTHSDQDDQSPTGDRPIVGARRPRRPWRDWGAGERAGVISALVAVLSLPFVVVDAMSGGDTPGPGQPSASPPTTNVSTGTGTPTVAPSTRQPPSPGPAGVVYAATLTPVSGALAKLPTTLHGQPGYGHPLVIDCPTNQTADKLRNVSFPLTRRYRSFTATVRPYYRLATDRPAAAQVTVLVGTRQVDDTVRTEQRGQRAATMDAPAPVTADVEGGDELTLRVRCDVPDGVVVLVDAALTPTG